LLLIEKTDYVVSKNIENPRPSMYNTIRNSKREVDMKRFIWLFCLVFLITSCSNLSPKKSANCVIVGSITVQEDFEGCIKFLGEIRNQGDGKALFVKITFTMKDSSDNVIGTDFTYVNSTDLNPGQTSSFECWTDVLLSTVSSWSYEITWDDED
jgi:hypothetical protein